MKLENLRAEYDKLQQKYGAKELMSIYTNFYSLDAIIAVGYRVNSKKATDFRIWATIFSK